MMFEKVEQRSELNAFGTFCAFAPIQPSFLSLQLFPNLSKLDSNFKLGRDLVNAERGMQYNFIEPLTVLPNESYFRKTRQNQ